jgi:hypothetical protein
MNCLAFELPNDERVKVIENILDKWRTSYLKQYLHNLVLSHRIKFILFNPSDDLISELFENVNSRYAKDDCVRQSKFELTVNERNFLIDMSLK